MSFLFQILIKKVGHQKKIISYFKKNYVDYESDWSNITRQLNGRTNNAVNNGFYSTLRKHYRKMKRKVEKSW